MQVVGLLYACEALEVPGLKFKAECSLNRA